MLTSIARTLRGLSLGIWLGSGVMTFIVADHVFFRSGLDQHSAGKIMAGILHTGGLMKVGIAILAIVCDFAQRKSFDPLSRKRTVLTATLLCATALALFAAFYLEPKMAGLRAQVGGFTDANKDSPERILFGKLHGASMGLATVEIALVAVALICAVL